MSILISPLRYSSYSNVPGFSSAVIIVAIAGVYKFAKLVIFVKLLQLLGIAPIVSSINSRIASFVFSIFGLIVTTPYSVGISIPSSRSIHLFGSFSDACGLIYSIVQLFSRPFVFLINLIA